MSSNIKRLVMGMTLVLAVAITGGLAWAATPGTISGTVTGTNGAVAGVKVDVYPYTGKHKHTAGSSTKGHHKHRTPVAEATTDSNGNFTLANVPDGNYIVVARLKGVGKGHAIVDLTSNSATASITLKAGHHHKKTT